jgi:alpha-N-arabinofuranosidase
MVDEHEYRSPDWHWENVQRFDAYDRAAAAVYLGEYAAHERDRRNTLRSALSEAAFMTGLERNGDLVRLASYAPLLAKQRRTQWVPDLIYFDNTSITPSVNYYVQQLFGQNAGNRVLPCTVTAEHGADLAVSCVEDSASGDRILKLVSRADAPVLAEIDLATLGAVEPEATCSVLTGDPQAEHVFGKPPVILPQVSQLSVGPQLVYAIPPHSLSVIRLAKGGR